MIHRIIVIMDSIAMEDKMSKSLLKRKKDIEVIEMDDNKLLLYASLCDEVHEMAVKVLVDGRDGMLLSAEATMLRCPYPDVCPSALLQVPKLAGITLTGGAGRRVRELMDQGQGCEHLKELLLDALRGYIPAVGYQTIRLLTEKYQALGLDENQVNSSVMEELERLGQDVVPGKCVVYNKEKKSESVDV